MAGARGRGRGQGQGRGRGRGRGKGKRYVYIEPPGWLPCPGCNTTLKRNGGQWHVHQRLHAKERQAELRDERYIEWLLTGEGEDPREEAEAPPRTPSLSPSLVEAAARLPAKDGKRKERAVEGSTRVDVQGAVGRAADHGHFEMPSHGWPSASSSHQPFAYNASSLQAFNAAAGPAHFRPFPPGPLHPAPGSLPPRIYSASPQTPFFPGASTTAPSLHLTSPELVAASQRFRRLCEMATLHVHLVEPALPVPLDGRYVIDMQSGAAIPGLRPPSQTVIARYSARDPRFDFRFSVPESIAVDDESMPHVVVVLEAHPTLPRTLPTTLQELVALHECRCWAFYPGSSNSGDGELQHLFNAIEGELRFQVPAGQRSVSFGWPVSRQAPPGVSPARLEQGSGVLLSMAANWIDALVPGQAAQWLAQSARTGALATANQYGLQGTADVSHTLKLDRAPPSWTFSLTPFEVGDGHGHLFFPELDDGQGMALKRGRGVIAAWRGDLVGTLCAAEFAARQDVEDVPRCPALIIGSLSTSDSDDGEESDVESIDMEDEEDADESETDNSRRVRFADEGRHESGEHLER